MHGDDNHQLFINAGNTKYVSFSCLQSWIDFVFLVR